MTDLIRYLLFFSVALFIWFIELSKKYKVVSYYITSVSKSQLNGILCKNPKSLTNKINLKIFIEVLYKLKDLKYNLSKEICMMELNYAL
jgi:hypothetical protein